MNLISVNKSGRSGRSGRRFWESKSTTEKFRPPTSTLRICVQCVRCVQNYNGPGNTPRPQGDTVKLWTDPTHRSRGWSARRVGNRMGVVVSCPADDAGAGYGRPCCWFASSHVTRARQNGGKRASACTWTTARATVLNTHEPPRFSMATLQKRRAANGVPDGAKIVSRCGIRSYRWQRIWAGMPEWQDLGCRLPFWQHDGRQESKALQRFRLIMRAEGFRAIPRRR